MGKTSRLQWIRIANHSEKTIQEMKKGALKKGIELYFRKSNSGKLWMARTVSY